MKKNILVILAFSMFIISSFATPTVVYAGVSVSVLVKDSKGAGISGVPVEYYSGGWQSFGTTDSNGVVSKDLPSGSYTFRVSYAGVSMQKLQNIGSDPNVVFQTTLVTMKLLDSKNNEIAGGA